MFLAGGSSTNPILNGVVGVAIVMICVLAMVGYYGQKPQWWSQDRRARKQQRENEQGTTSNEGSSNAP